MNLRAGIHRYFNPRSPWGERRYLAQRSAPSPPFQSTLPVGGATGVVPKVSQQALFQSTLPVEGSDSTYVTADATYTAFQSTLPVRGATTWYLLPAQDTKISIHAPREGSDLQALYEAADDEISIHAPREGSDRGAGRLALAVPISIHAPREGSDRWTSTSRMAYSRFQSTLPVRGATFWKLSPGSLFDFNPRSP